MLISPAALNQNHGCLMVSESVVKNDEFLHHVCCCAFFVPLIR